MNKYFAKSLYLECSRDHYMASMYPCPYSDYSHIKNKIGNMEIARNKKQRSIDDFLDAMSKYTKR